MARKHKWVNDGPDSRLQLTYYQKCSVCGQSEEDTNGRYIGDTECTPGERKVYVSFSDNGAKIDLDAYLATEEGKAAVRRAFTPVSPDPYACAQCGKINCCPEFHYVD